VTKQAPEDRFPEDDEVQAADAVLHFEVAASESGQRLDVFLSERAQTPRAQVRRWIEEGRALLNDAVVRPSRKLVDGDVIVAAPPEVAQIEIEPEALALTVLHEDVDLIVIDKSAGMVVHPAPGHPRGTLVNALLHHCDDLAGVGGMLRPGIVHRLDRGTSGVMVAAKNDRAHRHLAGQFHDHTIDRLYRTFVRALPSAKQGQVDAPIGRHPRDRKRMSTQTKSGRAAKTNWRVTTRYPDAGVSQLEIRPETGRTHQIRVHLSSQGMPIVGDPVYGRARAGSSGRGFRIGLDRPALHAARLAFTHPRSNEPVVFEAPLPEDLARFVRELEAFGRGVEKA